jgi:hypothetical protein
MTSKWAQRTPPQPLLRSTPEGDVGEAVNGVFMLPGAQAVGVGEDEAGPVDAGVAEQAGVGDVTVAEPQASSPSA